MKPALMGNSKELLQFAHSLLSETSVVSSFKPCLWCKPVTHHLSPKCTGCLDLIHRTTCFKALYMWKLC